MQDELLQFWESLVYHTNNCERLTGNKQYLHQKNNVASEVLKNTIREKIIGLILSGKFKPGDRIREHTLSRQLQVSRTPLREALISLEQSKLVRSEPNVGFTVQEMKFDLSLEQFCEHLQWSINP